MSGERAFRVEGFMDFLSFERGLSARTLSAYRRDLVAFMAFLEESGIQGPASVGPEHLRAYTFALKDRGLAPTSIRRAQSALRTYFGFLIAEGVLTEDPTERLEAPRATRRLPDVLDRTDVVRLVEAPDPDSPVYWRDRAMLEFLYATGVRVSELVGLNLRDLKLEDGFALVFGKGSKERIVPVGRTARTALERYLTGCRVELDRGRGKGRVFLNQRGAPLTRMTVWTVVRSAATRAGIQGKVSPHTLRHTAAMRLLQGGVDCSVIALWLGHESIETTHVYLHADLSMKEKALARTHPSGVKPSRYRPDDALLRRGVAGGQAVRRGRRAPDPRDREPSRRPRAQQHSGAAGGVRDRGLRRRDRPALRRVDR